MTKSHAPKGANQAVALLSNIRGYDITKFTPKHHQVHLDIVSIANDATQLLNKISSSSSLLTHPSVTRAKEHHARILELTTIIVRDSRVYREELIKLHQQYHDDTVNRVGRMSDPDVMIYGISMFQQYETWIMNFQNVVLVPFMQLSDLLEQISQQYPVEVQNV